MNKTNVKNIHNNDGSTLLLLVIIISIIIALGTSLLSVSMMNYKIKKSSTEMKKSFYMSEKGINASFSSTYSLVIESVTDSIEKAEEYLKIYPHNTSDAESIFSNNFKYYILSKIENRINRNDNPKVEVTNSYSLVFIDEKLIVSIKSYYIASNSVDATITTDLIIVVPDYNLIDSMDFATLMSFDNWKNSR